MMRLSKAVCLWEKHPKNNYLRYTTSQFVFYMAWLSTLYYRRKRRSISWWKGMMNIKICELRIQKAKFHIHELYRLNHIWNLMCFYLGTKQKYFTIQYRTGNYLTLAMTQHCRNTLIQMMEVTFFSASYSFF